MSGQETGLSWGCTLWAVFRRDVRLAARQGADLAAILAFFVLATTLFPLGVGPEANILARISAGVVWATALLAAMLSLDRIVQADFEDGTLEQLCLAPLPLPLLMAAKLLAHWITTGLPLCLLAPVLATMLNMPADGVPVLLFAMLLGTPCLSLIGGIGAAVTLGARRSGALVPLIVLPLALPVLIFGVGAVEANLQGLGARPNLLILGAILCLAAPLAPLACAAAARQAVS